MDIVIKNGRVYDPANRIDTISDVAIDKGKIVEIGRIDTSGRKNIDATGCIVTPGLIDMHTHLYPFNDFGVPAEATCFPSGVTTAVEAGSAGWSNFELNHAFVKFSKLDIKRFVNIGVTGFSTIGMVDEIDIRTLEGKGKEKIRSLYERYPGEISGIKICGSVPFFKKRGRVILEETVKMAEEVGTRVMIHMTDPELPTAMILSMMRRGDIITHMYHNRGSSFLIGTDKKVLSEAWEARKRGVVFDVGNARAHFSFESGIQALSQGFLPDTISTDLTNLGAFNRPVMFSLPFVMSKFVAMGMTVEQVLNCTTVNAANALGLKDGTGTLTVGSRADVAVLKLIHKPTDFYDYQGEMVSGDLLIKPIATIKDGDFVYRDIEF